MPKLKSRRGASKRFLKKSKRGMIKRAKAYKRHILTSKTKKIKRNMRRGGYVSVADHRAILQALPYL